MNFNLSNFVMENLTNGYNNGSFTAEQINIFAVNYKLKGVLTDEQVAQIVMLTTPTESEESAE